MGDAWANSNQRDTAIIQLQAVQPSPQSPNLIGGGPTPASQFPQQFNGSGNAECSPNMPSLLGQENNGSSGSHTPALYQPEHYPRALGLGQPLVGTSWQNRPFHVDFFTGTMIGDDAIDGQIGQEAGFFVGGRLGWDYDYYWGVESRMGFAWMSLFDRQHPENNIGNGNILVWDMSLLYYPWGDSRWRPFFLVGTGIEQLDSYGSALPVYSGTLLEFPFGAGLKYHFNEWLTWRVDVSRQFRHRHRQPRHHAQRVVLRRTGIPLRRPPPHVLAVEPESEALSSNSNDVFPTPVNSTPAAVSIHPPPRFVFQTGSAVSSAALSNQRVSVIFCCV